MMLTFLDGDLLNCDAQYIAHQTNCVSNTGRGLALSLFKKYPYANVYRNRIKPDIPGTISLHGDPTNRYVINMYGQNYPGKSKKSDTPQLRIQWFQACLNQILLIPNLKTIAFPYLIGCDLAGGD